MKKQVNLKIDLMEQWGTKSGWIQFGAFILCIVFFGQMPAYSQQKNVGGQLKNNHSEILTYATIMLKDQQEHVLGYTRSNADGRYTLVLPDSAEIRALYLEVNYLGYKKVRQQLEKGKYTYDFLMERQAIELKEIQIKNKPQIQSNGDTLRYGVASFARLEDRSIGDVIRHMPGINVAENGEISYNGKPISNLFIHGDDLMDGRYGLATRTITKEMIKSVDVIQHHQPIKVLKDKVITDDVAMNLVLKDENSLKLTGQAMLGAGLPDQFDAAFNTMVLSEQVKMLNTIKANNSGIDFRDDFAQLGTAGLGGSQAVSHPKALLSSGMAGGPDLPRANYYLNRSGIINLNNLLHTKSKLQLKSNMQLFLDRNTMNYSSRTENYLTGDTIRYNELQALVSKPVLFNASVTATANKASYFLNNNFRFNFGKGNNDNYMTFNGSSFGQRLTGHVYDIANDFHWVPALGNSAILDLRWYSNYYNNPQGLYVGEGLNSDILNNGQPYAAIKQHTEIPSFVNNLTASYSIFDRLIRQSYQFGLLSERQQLNSHLARTQPDYSVTAYTGDAGNALRWARDGIHFAASFDVKKQTWEASLNLPLLWQSIRYQQEEYLLKDINNQLFIGPTIRFRYLINAEDYLVTDYSYNNKAGNITDVYRGTILTNYRLLNANDAELQEQHTSGTGIYYSLRRSIIMLFFNGGLNYNKITANSILSSVISDKIQRTVLLPYKNDQSTFTVNAGVSKFLFSLNSSVFIKSSWKRGHYNQFINGQQFPFNNDTFTLNAGIDSKLSGTITLNYNGMGTWNTSRRQTTDGAGEQPENRVRRFDQNATLGYSLNAVFIVNFRGRHIYADPVDDSAVSYFFLDTNIRYKIGKWHTDLELNVTNLTNVKEYKLLSLYANQFAESRYTIRGRMAMLRATFNL